jgi:hypothetical protein
MAASTPHPLSHILTRIVSVNTEKITSFEIFGTGLVAVPKLSINFEEILSCVYGNFEGQIKVLESSPIIMNYVIIINNAYYMLPN